MTIQFWRLSEASDDNLGLACTADGLLLGRTPLIERRGEHFIARAQHDIERLFGRAYPDASEVERIMSGLGTVAAALNADDRCLACIAAVHLRIPDLPDLSARDRMEAEDTLIKYARGEEPDPEWDPTKHPRTGTAPNPGWFAPTEDENNESSPVRTAANEDPSRRTDAPPAPHDDWVHLRPGPKRIDELADFVEWIANARPQDEQAIRAEIKRYFCDVGDQASCHALNAHLTALLKPGITRENRQRLLDHMDQYTLVDPAETVRVREWITAGALAIGGVPPIAAGERAAGEAAAGESGAAAAGARVGAITSPAEAWKAGWGARGDYFSEALGANLPRNFRGIDRWENGTATSIKSIDLTAATYQDAARLTYRLNDYVDKIALYEGGKMGTIEVESSAITDRVLSLAIPKASMTAAQRVAIEAARSRARALGVELRVTEF